jgi:hypothetical protein
MTINRSISRSYGRFRKRFISFLWLFWECRFKRSPVCSSGFLTASELTWPVRAFSLFPDQRRNRESLSSEFLSVFCDGARDRHRSWNPNRRNTMRRRSLPSCLRMLMSFAL